MNTLRTTTAIMALAAVLSAGCAVTRGQETTGAYVDDVGISTSLRAKYIEDKTVSFQAINVETLNGNVQLSGFAKTSAEKAQAEALARNTKNVRSVKNDIVVRP
jgi:hyperosmotically inducible periplasmic protein